MSHFASWFSTPTGKKFTHWCVGTVAAAVFGNQIAVQGPLLDKVKDIFQLYVHDKPRPLPPKVNKLIEEVLHDSNLKEKQKKRLTFFYSVGTEPFHAGGTNSPWGAIVGIPFTLDDINSVNISDMRILGKEKIDWIIDGHDLLSALSISDNAKKFALMREIYSCNFAHVLTNAIVGGGCVIISAKIAQNVNAKTNAFERLSLGKRCARYFLFYCFGYILYHLMKDPIKHLADRDVDKLAADTGIDYLNGGIEYYKKTLLKNKALRELSESKFKRVYDEHGNENYLIFAPKMPTAKRLENLRELRKEKMGEVEKS